MKKMLMGGQPFDFRLLLAKVEASRVVNLNTCYHGDLEPPQDEDGSLYFDFGFNKLGTCHIFSPMTGQSLLIIFKWTGGTHADLRPIYHCSHLMITHMKDDFQESRLVS